MNLSSDLESGHIARLCEKVYMDLTTLYYGCKPFVSRRLQIAIRRWYVSKKRGPCALIWPIDEEAGSLPDKWSGWPDGKQFALRANT